MTVRNQTKGQKMSEVVKKYQQALKKQINVEMAQAEMREEAEKRGYRQCDAKVIVEQVGKMNIMGISGGRVIVRETGITLPVARGYSVEIDLNGLDLYDVKRVYTRAGERSVKGAVIDVYCEDVSDVAYYASCYVNVQFGGEAWQKVVA
jgi:hypothetical protein